MIKSLAKNTKLSLFLISLFAVTTQSSCSDAVPKVEQLSKSPPAVTPTPVRATPRAELTGTHTGQTTTLKVQARLKEIQQVEVANSRYKIKTRSL